MALKSIRVRMTLAFASSIAILMLIVCSSITLYALRAAKVNADTLLETVVHTIDAEQAHKHTHHRPSDFEELLTKTIDDLQPNGMAMSMVDVDGNVIGRSQRRLPSWPRTHDDGWRVKTIPYGEDTIVVGLPWGKTERELRARAIGLFIQGFSVVIVAAIGAWLVVGKTLSPIESLSLQARAASVDSLSVHLDAPSQDAEILMLVNTLNGLLDRLAWAADARGRFHSAASHELRTPLQALSGHLELALHRERTAPEYRAVVQESLKQTRRLISLTHDLLLLNQLGFSPLPVKEAVHLVDIHERALSNLAPTIRAQRLCIESDVNTEAEILAPSTHAEMLIGNLLENAIKYATPGGRVTTRISTIGQSGVRLDIFNECPPLPNWNADKLFEPFYRPDESRNSKTGGTGLGLAISKAIADANGWKLLLRQEPEGVIATVFFLF